MTIVLCLLLLALLGYAGCRLLLQASEKSLNDLLVFPSPFDKRPDLP